MTLTSRARTAMGLPAGAEVGGGGGGGGVSQTFTNSSKLEKLPCIESRTARHLSWKSSTTSLQVGPQTRGMPVSHWSPTQQAAPMSAKELCSMPGHRPSLSVSADVHLHSAHIGEYDLKAGPGAGLSLSADIHPSVRSTSYDRVCLWARSVEIKV